MVSLTMISLKYYQYLFEYMKSLLIEGYRILAEESLKITNEFLSADEELLWEG